MSEEPFLTVPEREAALHRQLAVTKFPEPEGMIASAYWALETSAQAKTPQLAAGLGDHRDLPRPWIPSSCTDPTTRKDLWDWLERVVVWLNHEYTWDTAAMIPACWSHHPHIINDLAVLADRRHMAGQARTGQAMEEWERQTLPGFISRMQTRLRQQCANGQHKPWPGSPREQTYLAEETARHRADRLAQDLTATNNIKVLYDSGKSFTVVITRSIEAQAGEQSS